MRTMIRRLVGWLYEKADSILYISLAVGFCFVLWLLTCLIVAVLG